MTYKVNAITSHSSYSFPDKGNFIYRGKYKIEYQIGGYHHSKTNLAVDINIDEDIKFSVLLNVPIRLPDIKRVVRDYLNR